MGLLQKLGMLCAALAVASCAAVQPRFPEKFQEVQIPPERISQKGFSLVPLNETGWVITGRSASQLALGKLGKTPEENVVIRAILFKLPPFKTNEEFVRLIKEAEAKREEAKNHSKLLKRNIQLPPPNVEFLKLKDAIETEIKNRQLLQSQKVNTNA